MKEIKVGKLIIICLGVMIINTIVMFAIFGEDIGSNLVGLVTTIIILLILLKLGGINKEIVVDRIDDLKKKFKFKEIMGVVLTQILLSLAIGLIISAVIYYVNPEKAIELMNEDSFYAETTLELVISYISIVIIAPILEEIIFRRIMFNRFSRKIGIIGGALLSSAIFGVLHMELAMIGAMVYGVTCCILYRKYNNILIPMSVHFINNLIVTIFGSIGDGVEGTDAVDYTMTVSDMRYFLIIGSVLLLIGIILFAKFIWKNKQYLKKENMNTLTI